MSLQDIQSYYSATKIEDNRLELHVFQVEGARSRQIIEEYLQPGMTIADIGGATGVYSFWLHDKGHKVHLLDATEYHIQKAKEIASDTNRNLESIQVGDARKLPFEDNQFDMVLLFGPLYHLLDQADRIKSLKEAHRVLKPGGIILAATISRHASLLEGFWNDIMRDPDFEKIVEEDQSTGNHLNPTSNPNYFTEAHFHTQEERDKEFREAGFATTETKAIEGFGWLVPDFENRWKDKEYRTKLLQYIRLTETDPAMISFSAHVMTIANKPAQV